MRLTSVAGLLAPIAAVMGLCAAGCAAPLRPYGQPDFVREQVPHYRPLASPAVAGGKTLLVLGALEDLTVAPVGGLYNLADYSVTPLIRTYHYWALVPKLIDELHRSLTKTRRLRVAKEYLDLGRPIPFPRPTYPADLLVLRGDVLRFGFARDVSGEDVIIADFTFRLLTGDSGRILWRGPLSIALRLPLGGPAKIDPFAAVAEQVGGRLLNTPGFHAALSRGAP
jgi:hypothetical protein